VVVRGREWCEAHIHVNVRQKMGILDFTFANILLKRCYFYRVYVQIIISKVGKPTVATNKNITHIFPSLDQHTD
jgi:hypothetical protein